MLFFSRLDSGSGVDGVASCDACVCLCARTCLCIICLSMCTLIALGHATITTTTRTTTWHSSFVSAVRLTTVTGALRSCSGCPRLKIWRTGNGKCTRCWVVEQARAVNHTATDRNAETVSPPTVIAIDNFNPKPCRWTVCGLWLSLLTVGGGGWLFVVHSLCCS